MRFSWRNLESYPIHVGVTVDQGMLLSKVLPNLIEAGLSDPLAFDDLNLIYGQLEDEATQHRVLAVIGVVAVQQTQHY